MRNIQPHEMCPQPKLRAAICAGDQCGAGAGGTAPVHAADVGKAHSRGRDALLIDTAVISGRTVARIMLAIASRAFPRAEWRNSQWWGRRTTFSFDQIRDIADGAIAEAGGGDAVLGTATSGGGLFHGLRGGA